MQAALMILKNRKALGVAIILIVLLAVARWLIGVGETEAALSQSEKQLGQVTASLASQAQLLDRKSKEFKAAIERQNTELEACQSERKEAKANLEALRALNQTKELELKEYQKRVFNYKDTHHCVARTIPDELQPF